MFDALASAFWLLVTIERTPSKSLTGVLLNPTISVCHSLERSMMMKIDQQTMIVGQQLIRMGQ